MLAGPALALVATCLLLGVAAMFAPRRPADGLPADLPVGLPADLPVGLPAGRRAQLRIGLSGLRVGMPEARAAFALVPLGVGLGIALALGLMPGTGVALVGAFAACTAGHCLLARATASRGLDQPRGGLGPGGAHAVGAVAALPAAWLTLLACCVLAALLRLSTLDVTTALAAQAAIGPGALGGPSLFSAVDVLGGLVGLMAGAAWVENLPRLGGSPAADGLDALLRWGEAALAGAAVSALVWGPPVGALVHGPAGVLLAPVAVSTAVTLAAVGAVSMLRSTVAQIPRAALLGTLGPVAVVALLAARLA